MDMSLSEHRELVMDREAYSPWGRKESDTTKWLNWTEQDIHKTEKTLRGLCPKGLDRMLGPPYVGELTNKCTLFHILKLHWQ